MTSNAPCSRNRLLRLGAPLLTWTAVAAPLQPPPQKVVGLTSDDSVKFHRPMAALLLAELCFSATFFVTERSGSRAGKQDDLKMQGCRAPAMSDLERYVARSRIPTDLEAVLRQRCQNRDQ